MGATIDNQSIKAGQYDGAELLLLFYWQLHHTDLPGRAR
ncbi:Uncharacterised protein [Vibrio cholerae]|nr:Uncharacterised protein [Vibrio cholerae]